MNNEQTQTCAYCREVKPISNMIQGKIIFRNGHYIGGIYKQFVDEKVNWYCKDKPCHGYDQMGHEG
jgi:hypothetical protein